MVAALFTVLSRFLHEKTNCRSVASQQAKLLWSFLFGRIKFPQRIPVEEKNSCVSWAVHWCKLWTWETEIVGIRNGRGAVIRIKFGDLCPARLGRILQGDSWPMRLKNSNETKFTHASRSWIMIYFDRKIIFQGSFLTREHSDSSKTITRNELTLFGNVDVHINHNWLRRIISLWNVYDRINIDWWQILAFRTMETVVYH